MKFNLLILCVILIIVYFIYFLCSRREYYKLLSKFPGPLGYPLIGIAHKLLRKGGLLKLLRTYIRDYGTTVITWMGPLPVLIVSDPQVTQDVLTSPYCVNKSFMYKIIDDAIGTGLFSLKDPVWSEHRKLLNPAFAHKVLLNTLPIFNRESEILVNELDKLVDAGELDLMPLLQHCSLSIATQSTMGSSVKEEPKFKNKSLMTYYQCLQECIADFTICPWLNIKIIRQLFGKEECYENSKLQIRKFISKLVAERLEADISGKTPANNSSFLNLAVGHFERGIFSRKNIEAESNIMVFAAFETSSKTVGYALMLLAMFPECQERVFEEIKTLFPKSGDFSVSYEEAQQMVYLDLVMNETMRLIAPVPLVARETSNDFMLSNGVHIPKGMQIVIDIFHMHRSKDIWGPDAESFNPDHFLPHNLQDKHPYAFIPFTKGIRSCIGWRYGLLSLKVTLAKLLRNYRFSTKFKFEDLQYVENVTIKLKTTPLLKLERRI
ncbi:probable cytochrome P450 313a4 [Drosophila grimshawi]|uniref:GH15389 n=1 Tax=Drosophila grimshawi TaxID=7222 RepID=B4JUN7_DROGR|nr:probable cytochrome P450 313a4 [Drosophila grimshawi]EDV91207.1 GH15389 [Drosophila grimshawi]